MWWWFVAVEDVLSKLAAREILIHTSFTMSSVIPRRARLISTKGEPGRHYFTFSALSVWHLPKLLFIIQNLGSVLFQQRNNTTTRHPSKYKRQVIRIHNITI